VTGFYALYLGDMQELTVGFYTTTNELAPLKDFMGLSHTSQPTNATEWTRRATFMPMLTAGQQPVFADKSAALRVVLSDAFDPRNIVFLPPEARTSVTARRAADAKVSSPVFTAQKIAADIESSTPAMVVVAQAFYHPWRAYVDGKPTFLWRANHAFQAFEAPAGRHRITLVYEDRKFWLGAVVSGVSLVAFFVILATNGRRNLN
jgi:hypothetical protein